METGWSRAVLLLGLGLALLLLNLPLLRHLQEEESGHPLQGRHGGSNPAAVVGREKVVVGREKGVVGFALLQGSGAFSQLRSRRSILLDSSAAPPTTTSLPPHNRQHRARRWGVGLALGLISGASAALLLATLTRIMVPLVGRREREETLPIIFNKLVTHKMIASLDCQGGSVLGEGGSGKVYETKLQPGDVAVAVKVVKAAGDVEVGAAAAQTKLVQAELETLGGIRHRNLVALLAYVVRDKEHLLIYELMPNGSLASALNRSNAGELDLDWSTRFKIAQGTVTGLAYLHHDSNPRLVHRDIKPGNVLLDKDWEPRIGDFGLAKMLEQGRTHATSLVVGTFGYIAPEYFQTSQFTTHSDIYSLGMTLAALFTGKLPTSSFFLPDGMQEWLTTLARQGRLMEALDSRLLLTPEQQKEAVSALQLVLLCIATVPARRPDAYSLLKLLLQISGHEQMFRRTPLEDLIQPDPLHAFTQRRIVPRDSSSSTPSSSSAPSSSAD